MKLERPAPHHDDHRRRAAATSSTTPIWLGLRLVKKTVNFDQPEAYHLYFGDETGGAGLDPHLV